MLLTYISAIIVTFGGGFSWFFVKSHALYKIPLEFSIFYRQFFAAVFLLIIAILRRSNLKINKNQFKLCIVVSFLYYFLYFVGAYTASIYIIAGITSFISSTKVIFVELILAGKEKRRPSGRIIIGSILGIIGILLMSKGSMSIDHIPLLDFLIGLSLAFISPISNALTNVIIDHSNHKKTIDNFVMVSYCSFMSSFAFLIIGLIRNGKFVALPLKLDYLIGLGYLSFVASGITMICLYYLISRIGSLSTTYMSIFHSPVAVLLAVVFQGYPINGKIFTGIMFCIISLYIGNKYSIKKSVYQKISQERKKRHFKKV